MYCGRKRKLSLLLSICLLFMQVFLVSPVLASPNAAPSPSADRIAGNDRYTTAVAISQQGWNTSDYVVLARGDDFADALCAGPLAYYFNGPILLTQPGTLNEYTLNELTRLGVTKVFIVGGQGAVSASVEAALKKSGIQAVERISGADRYETSVKIAEKIGGSSQVVLAPGNDFPDALSISAIAAKLKMPILLTAKNTLPESVEKYIQSSSIAQTYIVGGTGVISSGVENSLPNPQRLAGKDRYETNTAILTYFSKELIFDKVYVATGNKFADALTGAVLAAKNSAPLILLSTTLPSTTSNYLKDHMTKTSAIIGFGGQATVNNEMLNNLKDIKEGVVTVPAIPPVSGGGGNSGSPSATVSEVTVTTTPVNVAGLAYDAGDVMVSLATSTLGAQIRYTTDGSTPTAASTLYTAPFAISNTQGIAGGTYIVKAIGLKSGMSNSPVATKNIVYSGATTVTVNTASELKTAIETNSVSTINVGQDITGDVTGSRAGTNDFAIHFGANTLIGNLSLTANNVAAINLTGTAIPAISGNLVVAAANATVTNAINVGRTITVRDVGDHSWIERADGNALTLTDANGASIVIEGNPQDITVEEGANGLSITANSPVVITVNLGATVSNITASGTATGTIITNNGTIANVTADTDVAIVNNSSSASNIQVAGTGTIGVSGTASANITTTTATVVQDISATLRLDPAELRIGSITTANISGVTAGAGETLQVTSANSSIVSVDAVGGLALTARSPGRVAITVKVLDESNAVSKQGTIFVTVQPALLSTASVVMTAPAAGSTPQTITQIEAANTHSDYTVTSVTWNEALTAAGKFKAGQIYTARVVLTSKNSKAFQPAAFTPNVVGSSTVGTTTTLGTASGNKVSFNVTFPSTVAPSVTGIVVTTQPLKMSYQEGSDGILNLNGLAITATHNDGTTANVTFTNGTTAGYTANPAHGATLTSAAHNGKPIIITHETSGKTAATANLNVLPLATAPDLISSITTTKDEITVTFTENITAVNMPNNITLASGTYQFDVFTNNGQTRLGHYGLLSQTANTMNIAVLGNWGALNPGTYEFKLYTGEFSENPNVSAQREITFQPWEGINSAIDPFIASSDEIWVTLENATSQELVTGLGTSDFQLFDFLGNKIAADFFIGSQRQPYLPDHEYCFTPTTGSFEGYYRVRFAKAGYNPHNQMFQVLATNPGGSGEPGDPVTPDFIPGEGGTITFEPFTAEENKIGGLYIAKNHDYYYIIFDGDPIYHHNVELSFIPAQEFGAEGYMLQHSLDSGGVWEDYPSGTISAEQDNYIVSDPRAQAMYRLVLIGGPQAGYTSNEVTAGILTIKTEFTGYFLDESMFISGVMAPWVGRGLEASFTAEKQNYPDANIAYTDEHMTYQWYRVNPISYDMTAIPGATQLTYITTEDDIGYKHMVRATGDDANISGFIQVMSNWGVLTQNRAYVSNITNTGFTLNLHKAVSGLTANDLSLVDYYGDTVAINSVTQGADAGIYNISADLDLTKGPYRLANDSDFWRMVSPSGHGEHFFEGVQFDAISVEPEAMTLAVGSTGQILAKVNLSTTNQEVTWSTSNPAVATVDATGTVTGVSLGTATIRVTLVANSSVYKDIEITVGPDLVVGNGSITVGGENPSITLSITADTFAEGATDKGNWQMSVIGEEGLPMPLNTIGITDVSFELVGDPGARSIVVTFTGTINGTGTILLAASGNVFTGGYESQVVQVKITDR